MSEYIIIHFYKILSFRGKRRGAVSHSKGHIFNEKDLLTVSSRIKIGAGDERR